MEALYTKMIKGGATTYFIDLWEAKCGEKYITLTASVAMQQKEPGKVKYKKHSLVVLPECLDEFNAAFNEVIKKAKE